MKENIKVKTDKPGLLELFGLYYLKLFQKKSALNREEIPSDIEIKASSRKIINRGIIYASIIGIVCVLPTIWIDLYLQSEPYISYWAGLMLSISVSIIIELFLLFVLAIYLVNSINKIIFIKENNSDFLNSGLFSVNNILARTALELPDPELEILGIDPFKQISRKNLLIIGLLYKAKIFLSNLILKSLLILFVGKMVFGVSILYEALIVECFWNAIVVIRIVNEARMRLFGYALSHEIVNRLTQNNTLNKLSPLAREGCLRSIGNAVVMTQNYHPNMIVLLINFQNEIKIPTGEKLDSWPLFLNTINQVDIKEKYFLMDLFTVAVAFDGKISNLERNHLKEIYQNDYDIYNQRLHALVANLRYGNYHQALEDCTIDFNLG
jgi:hypothetical protein